jgi:hypothetical protein
MKWYETPLAVQWDNALELLKQGKVEAYTKTLKCLARWRVNCL